VCVCVCVCVSYVCLFVCTLYVYCIYVMYTTCMLYVLNDVSMEVADQHSIHPSSISAICPVPAACAHHNCDDSKVLCMKPLPCPANVQQQGSTHCRLERHEK
jgi:hypothetical protein